METESTQPPSSAIAADVLETTCRGTSQEAPTAHWDYVLAERNKRVRALWAETPAADAARAYLTGACGLSTETIKQFHMGLVSTRSRAGEENASLAICIPVPDRKGPQDAPCLAADRPEAKRRGQYVLIDIPDVAGNAEVAEWKRGATLTMYITPVKGADLIVCARVMEAICLAQFLNQCCAGRFTIIVSSHLNEFPAEWHSPGFWVQWQRIYLAHCGDEKLWTGTSNCGERCDQLARWAQRPVLRVKPPTTVGWAAFFKDGATEQTLLEMFSNAEVVIMGGDITQKLGGIEPPRLDEFAEGEYGDVTHDVAYNYIGGFYYYPFSVLKFSLGANEQKQITRLTRLLRNDGQILGWKRVPSATGASDVIAADDGTLLSRPPEVSESATWSLNHILSFASKAKAGTYAGRRLSEILRDMLRLFEQCVWLPRQEQMMLLLFTVPITYVQELFSAVPYILIHGPKGSGKSELAHILSKVSSNSTIIGSGSHAFTAAQIDQARGLIVLDDRETLAADELDSDLLELLKIGYKRATGVRGIIGQNRKIIRQHVYGVKAITCVSGVEEVVGTRMLKIRTAPFSLARSNISIRPFQAVDQEMANGLRQEMHGWAFKNVNRIAVVYEKLLQSSSRWNEITAPLRTFAVLSEDPELHARLNSAIQAQEIHESGEVTVEEMLNTLLEDLVRRGLDHEFSVTHIANELALRLGSASTQVGELLKSEKIQESWITRTLKAQDWLKPGGVVRRTRLRKKPLQRIWEINPARIAKIRQSQSSPPPSLHALSFCECCDTCEYARVCQIMHYFRPKVTITP